MIVRASGSAFVAAVLIAVVIAVGVAVAVGRHVAARAAARLGGEDFGCPARPNCVSSAATDAAHRVPPIAGGDDLEATLERVRKVVAAMPGSRMVEARDGYLRAEIRSLVFGFVDDLEVRADPASGGLQIRSASRLGHSDLGVNRRRVEAIRCRLGERRAEDSSRGRDGG